MSDEANILKTATEALKKVAGDPVELHLDVTTALMLIGNIQLALQHPDNVGVSAKKIKELAMGLSQELKTKYPELAVIIDAGWIRQSQN